MPSRPVYRVAAAGLDPRDVRLIEIVFKHSQYNRFEFVLEAALVADRLDILIVNLAQPDGLRALDWLRTLDRHVPVVSAMPRGAPVSARHAISIDRLTLQLLPMLNRVVEMEWCAPDARAPQAAAAAPSAAGMQAAPSPARGAMTTARAQSLPPASQGSTAGLRTQEFLREAARRSRDGDSARDAAAPAAFATAAPVAAAATPVAASSPASPVAPAVATGLAVPAGPVAGTAPPSGSAGAPRPATNLVAFPHNGELAAPQIRVLVVDDSPTVRKQLSLAFARMRIECDAVASAAQALQRLDEHHFDLALVDVVMPEVDGYKLTRQIRRSHRGMPVIILTSRSSPFDLARGALAGCSSYLVKPVPLRQLEAAIVKHVRRSLAIDDLHGLMRLSGDPHPASPAPQGAGAPARAAPTPDRASRSAGR